ncbi:MAG: FeoB-associated Cys-rich membrane protein [Clostridiales bacterium]|nr:FeoB-associated Cys-rich membrane protein [Clostridiales bacterium]MCD8132842.1 FeoB-associated Cys-rich membrane protein [Clostridiales bacterium]
MEWIIDNLSTVIIGLLLLAAVIFAVRTLIKDHKNGRCSGGCPGCSHTGKCPHTKK